MSIEGKVVVITGGGKGVGRYAATAFAKEGARVVVADVFPLDEVTADLKAIGPDFLAVSCDVRDESQVKSMVDQAVEKFNQVDVLINNAAIVTHFPPLPPHGAPAWPKVRDMEKSFWDRVIDTNLGGTFLCTKHVIPFMERQRSGHIVNVYGGGPATTHGTCAYAISKEAIRFFTRYVAEEEREYGICVVMTGPGAMVNLTEQIRRVPMNTGAEEQENAYVAAAQAGMHQSGHSVSVRFGNLEAEIR